MSLEHQLERIVNRADMHRRIDALHDDDVMLVLTRPSDLTSERSSRFEVYGNPTVSTLLWMVKEFEHWLFGATPDA